MAPIKSSLARSVSKLLGVFKDTDLSLRGDVQSSRFVAPPPKKYWEFKVWGAGGGGDNNNKEGVGGGGAYITGQYEIAPNTTITLVVGSRGVYPVGLNVANYGGGGPKGTTFAYSASTGGGMSGVFLTSSTVFTSADSPTPAGIIATRPTAAPNVQPGATVQNCLIAAAGGGACVGPYGVNGHGGGGGVTSGGGSIGTDPAGGGSWNGAGSDTGSGGSSDSGTNGGLFYGGSSTGGGGGGGGFYGGGGGGNSSSVSGGAGGASYYKTTQAAPPALIGYNPGSQSGNDGKPGSEPANPGTAGHAGNRSDPLNNGSYGSGLEGSSGQDGLVAYRRAISYAALPGASWTSVTHTGTDQTISTGNGVDTGDGL